MARPLACLLLLALAQALGGCGDDVEDTADPITEPGGSPDASPLPRIKVTNTGEPCSEASGCQGDVSQCLEESPAGTSYPDGYCTADCTQSAECGPGAVCPVSEAEAVAPSYAFTSTWARKCFKTCTLWSSDCRPGYECESLADAYRAWDAPAPMHQTVCIPHGRPSFGFDAGAFQRPDAGRSRARSDASVIPPASPDAGSIDAGH